MRLEISYCAPRGIPHSVFLGRVVEQGDPQWLDADRDKALWWLIHERMTCQSCGTRPDEWDDDLHAYSSEPTHCRGCEVKAQGDEWFDNHRKEFRRGTSMQFVRVPAEED